MKNKTFLLVILIVTGILNPLFAAFPLPNAVKSHSEKTFSNEGNKPATGCISGKANFHLSNISPMSTPTDGSHKPPHKKIGSGQLLSFIFGILGLAITVTGFFCIPAIILGAIGIHRRKKFSHNGLVLSIIGLSLGIIVFAFIILVALIAG
jgi:hypothetical protein